MVERAVRVVMGRRNRVSGGTVYGGVRVAVGRIQGKTPFPKHNNTDEIHSAMSPGAGRLFNSQTTGPQGQCHAVPYSAPT
jgi:hypothetical protein